jgi:signal transduction histidine kinase
MTTGRAKRLNIRARLTLVYGGLFLLAGILLLVVTYLLVSTRLPYTFQLPVPASGQQRTAVFANGRNVLIGQGDPEVFQYLNAQAARIRNTALTSLLTQGAIALGLVGAIAVALGWLVAGRMVAPIQRVTETARRIAAAPAADRGLHERIALGGPRDELRELADTFDAMLARLDHAFDGQRRFVANASHELRTPLTLNRALLELAAHRRTASPDVRELAETLLQVNARHERLISGLLLLARSENEVTERSPVDLADVVDHVAAQAGAQATAAGVAVRTKTAAAPVAGDPVLLERVVQNLVDNAIRYNRADAGWVRIRCGAGPDGTTELVVSNSGPVVPRYDIPGLFEPFRRLGTDRPATAPGAGLGLSIVRAIARAHHGEVRAEPRAGGGLELTVALPSA